MKPLAPPPPADVTPPESAAAVAPPQALPGRRAILTSAHEAVGRAQELAGTLRRMADSTPTAEERAVECVDRALREFGATIAVTYRLTRDGETLQIVGATHDLADLPFGGAEVPLLADLPACEAVRTGRVVRAGTREALLQQFPALRPVVERLGIHASAAVPSRHMGRVQGALVLAWDRPHQLAPAEQVELRVLAGRVARALAYARLYYAERAAHVDAERARMDAESARAEAEAARRLAEDANRAKDDFLAVVSHELRTPLQAILGFSDLLEAEIAGPLAPRQRDYVRRVQSAGGHLLDTIENLLGFARAQAGKETVDAAPFDAAAVVAQVLDIAAPLAGRKGLALAQEGACTGVLATTDEKKVRQIVTNLVGNAVKFTDVGRVTAEAAVVLDAAGRDRLRITVRDTGVGIPAADLARVFEPFVQVSGGPAATATTRPVGGTGLGLSIVRQLARLLGGDVTPTSEAGRGSEFVVEVPRVFGGGR